MLIVPLLEPAFIDLQCFHIFSVKSCSVYQSAIEFLNILNNQDPKIQYTMDAEDADKTLQFFDLKIKNAER